MKESVYYKPWIDPWKVLSWGLEVAGLKSPQAGDGKIKDSRIVVLKNVEVCSLTVVGRMG
jgi:charged multivesicular body protein 7